MATACLVISRLSVTTTSAGHYITYRYTWALYPIWSEASTYTGVGHPYELYDRIYYDPETGKRL